MEIQVGRDPGCELVLPSASVSRRHATLRFLADAVEVIDRGSATGVRAAGVQVSGSAVVRFSDALEIGEFTLTMEGGLRGITLWPASAVDKPRLLIAVGLVITTALIGVAVGGRLGKSASRSGVARLESQAVAAARAEVDEICAQNAGERCAALLCRLMQLVPGDPPTRARLAEVEAKLPATAKKCRP